MTKDQQVKRQMGQRYCLVSTRRLSSAKKVRRRVRLGSANAERSLKVPNGSKKLTKPKQASAHYCFGTQLPNSMVFLPGELQRILAALQRRGELAPCHEIVGLHLEYQP